MEAIKKTEQAVLVNALTNKECLIDTIEAGDIFRFIPHKQIFMVMNDMVSTGGAVSMETVLSALPKLDISVLTDIMQSQAPVRSHKTLLENLALDFNKERSVQIAKEFIVSAQKGEHNIQLAIAELMAVGQGNKIDIFKDFSKATEKEITEIFNRNYFISTGIPPLDRIIIGLGKTDLITIAGMPGGGKTTLALNMAFNIPKTLFMSYEMSIKVELYAKALSYFSGVNSMKIMNPDYNCKLSDIEMIALDEAKEEIKKLNLRMAEKPVSFHTLIPAIRYEVARNKPPLIVIDYLQLIPSDGRSQEERITNMTNSLKQLAKDIEIPIVILSQFTKEGYKGGNRPTMADLRGSGSIAQDSNVILICHDGKVFVDKSRMTTVGEIPDLYLSKAEGRYKAGYQV
jgi:replicative DNA helicase